MILTITPNPTIDRAVFVRGFQLGELARGDLEVVTPSGKGVDASLVLHALGYATRALGLQAGRQGRLARELLDALGIAHDFVEAEGETRHALVLIDRAAGRQSTISVATLRAAPPHLAQLLDTLGRHLPAARGAVLAGSLPPGWPPDAYAPMLARCRSAGALALLDTSGAALAASLTSGGTMPDIVKVNLAELRALAPGGALPDGGEPGALAAPIDAIRARHRLPALVVTLGARGAIAATDAGAWLAAPPPLAAVNDAGAGDALAGVLAAARADGAAWPEALRLASAAAAAVVGTPGTAECDPAAYAALRAQVQIRPLVV